MRSRTDTNKSIRPKLDEGSLHAAGEDHGLMPEEKIGGKNRVENDDDEQIKDDQPEANVETREVHGVRTPYKPSPKEIAEHNLTHLNFRDWCPTCVQGRGVSDPHRRESTSRIGPSLPCPQTTVLCAGIRSSRRMLRTGKRANKIQRANQ